MKAEWQNELSLEIIMVVIEFDPLYLIDETKL